MIELKVFSFGVQKPKRKCYMDHNLSSCVGSSLTDPDPGSWMGTVVTVIRQRARGFPMAPTDQFVLCTMHNVHTQKNTTKAIKTVIRQRARGFPMAPTNQFVLCTMHNAHITDTKNCN